MAYSLKYTYNSSSQSYSVTGWSTITTSDKVVIPNTYNDGTNGEHPLTSIGSYAFEDCSSLTSVTIGSSVTSIGWCAFRGCSSLTNIEIPNSVTSIGNDAFNSCSSLTSIEIPNSITDIGDNAFRYCDKLEEITYVGTKKEAVRSGIGNRSRKKWRERSAIHEIICNDGVIDL